MFVVGVSCRGQSRAQPCDVAGPQPLLIVSGARAGARGQSSSRTSCPGKSDE